MREPMTPTGRREARAAVGRIANMMYMRWEHPDIVKVIVAIEREAAAAERERLRDEWAHNPNIIDTVERIGWSAAIDKLLADPEA